METSTRTWRWLALFALAAALQLVSSLTQLYTPNRLETVVDWNLPWAVLFVALLAAAWLVATPLDGEIRRSDDLGDVTHALLLAAILALAFALRTYALDDVPPGFFQDEAMNANEALELGKKQEWWIWSTNISGRPTAFLYALLGTIELFGQSYLALKVLPVTLGVAAVGSTYLLGRFIGGRQLGLLAAFLLAASRWHVHYSRMAWEAIGAPLFASLGFALLVRGLTTPTRVSLWLAGSGAAFGAGLYTYAGFRAVPVAAVIFLLVLMITDRGALRGRWLALSAWPLGLLAVAGPLIAFAVREPHLFWARHAEVSLLADAPVSEAFLPFLHQVAKSLLAFHHIGDSLVRHNLPEAAQLDPITGWALFVGIALSWPLRRSLTVKLCWAWILTVVLLAATTTEAPHATRLLPLLPAVIVLAAVGAGAALDRLRRHLDPPRLRQAATGLVAAAIVAVNAHAYFVRHPRHPEADLGFNVMARALCDDLQSQPGTFVFWTDDVSYWVRPQCEFLAPAASIALDVLTDEQVISGNLPRTLRPAIILVGAYTIQKNRDRIAIGPDGIPQIDLPVAPEVVRNRHGEVLYYLYRLG